MISEKGILTTCKSCSQTMPKLKSHLMLYCSQTAALHRPSYGVVRARGDKPENSAQIKCDNQVIRSSSSHCYIPIF
ncbi:hypothetical protein BD779DRAFT_1546605 [Infundibulicybe gibba]|nr:hypothetical protein BD779DRAFT_1546605 [Infundibulicybe gibba]